MAVNWKQFLGGNGDLMEMNLSYGRGGGGLEGDRLMSPRMCPDSDQANSCCV